jgi:steroid delta-isomerase-like uncharacterized protein
MDVIQATSVTTLNPSPGRKEAAGKNIKWKRKLPGPHPRRLEGTPGRGKKNNSRSSFDIGGFPRRIADPDVSSVAQTCPEEERIPMLLDNKSIVRRLYEEVWNKRRLDVVDELISPSHALNDPIISGSQMGPDLYKRRVVELTTGFPDLRFTIEDMIAEKGKVGVSWTISGTHQGEFLNIPATGSKIFVEGITIHDISNGKILDSQARWDALGLLRQLGGACRQRAASAA